MFGVVTVLQSDVGDGSRQKSLPDVFEFDDEVEFDASVESLSVFGHDGVDAFDVVPSTATMIQIDGLLASVDIVPDSEDEKRFVRKAVPGDHVVKLKPDTILKLNHRMGDVMEMLDYY